MNRKIIIIAISVLIFLILGYCLASFLIKSQESDVSETLVENENSQFIDYEIDENQKDNINASINIIFLHHSTGENIWNGGVQDFLA
jgi:anionic cell wall polymer biosynthesis LytR-Cps2A-Psr (LCP) family protein